MKRQLIQGGLILTSVYFALYKLGIKSMSESISSRLRVLFDATTRNLALEGNHYDIGLNGIASVLFMRHWLSKLLPKEISRSGEVVELLWLGWRTLDGGPRLAPKDTEGVFKNCVEMRSSDTVGFKKKARTQII
ncbi:hypothetical protein FNV43_RR19461 [Rhamnella rubrinervis]|uniref:Uncharacterized protein n=1 Tax=Rhamnella rubrinervis TaxID=2594499 RepID=A0A8K0DZ96_9ROSA|nr:hypothetical protein FNV43_RR19461 [Rhamnella rubrinervis]